MKKWLAGLAGVAVVVLAGLPALAGAATAVTLTRAPYVTDLTTTSAYVDWAIGGQQTAGSVMVQKAPASGVCPTSIAWNASQEITSPTSDPLVSGSSTSASWKVTVGTTTEYQAETPVTGLLAATRYCYAVYSSHSSSAKELWPVQTFTTLAPAGTSAPVTFDVLGDTGENLSNTGVAYPNLLNVGEQSIYQEIGQSGAQFLLMAGDVAYNGGTETTYGDLTQTGVDVSDIFGPSYLPQADGVPTFVADGNHGQTSDDLRIWPEPKTVAASKGVYSYGAPPAQVDGITTSSPSDWYAIQDGQVRVYVLDAAWADASVGTTTGAACTPFTSDCLQYQADHDEHWQTTSTEYKWLQADLAAHPGGVKMAVFHYPVRSVNNTQPTDPYLSGLTSLLAANGVQVAFNGHAHTYQRFVPSAGGLASFVTGGGGGILEPVDGNGDIQGACQAAKAQYSVYAVGWNPTTSTGSACGSASVPTSPMQVFNYLKVTVNGGQVTVNAVNAAGVTFDTTTFNYGAGDTQAPSVPTGLATTSVTSSSVGLSWKPSTDNVGVTGYNVLRDGTKIGTTNTTTYADNTVAPSTGYQYTVEAFDAASNTSAPSTPLPVTTPAGSPPPAVSFVQSAGGTGKSLSLGSPAHAGDLLVLSASLYTGATSRVTAVADSAGDTWKPLVDAFTSGHNSDGTMWYTVAKGPVSSVSVTTNTASVALGVQEFSGLGASPAVNAGSGSNTGTTASANTTGAGLVVGFVAGHASTQAITLGAGFSAQAQETSASPVASIKTAYQLSGSSPTLTGTFTAAMYWSAGVAVFS